MASQSRKHRWDCQEWGGNLSKAGYGVVSLSGKNYYVHRLSYNEWYGDIPEGMYICHKCDNRKCYNPSHLFLGAPTDNNRDMYAKGRGVKVSPPKWRKIELHEIPGIIDRFQGGESKQSIAEDFSVSRQAIHYLLKREGVL